MNVKQNGVLIADAASAHVGLIRYDQRCRDGIRYDTIGFVMVGDG